MVEAYSVIGTGVVVIKDNALFSFNVEAYNSASREEEPEEEEAGSGARLTSCAIFFFLIIIS